MDLKEQRINNAVKELIEPNWFYDEEGKWHDIKKGTDGNWYLDGELILPHKT